jgi:hypothetical protein
MEPSWGQSAGATCSDCCGPATSSVPLRRAAPDLPIAARPIIHSGSSLPRRSSRRSIAHTRERGLSPRCGRADGIDRLPHPPRTPTHTGIAHDRDSLRSPCDIPRPSRLVAIARAAHSHPAREYYASINREHWILSCNCLNWLAEERGGRHPRARLSSSGANDRSTVPRVPVARELTAPRIWRRPETTQRLAPQRGGLRTDVSDLSSETDGLGRIYYISASR